MKTFLVTLLLFISTGCTTSLTHVDISQSVPDGVVGFPYFLPKERFTITVTYELLSCPDRNLKVRQEATINVLQTATITDTSIADEKESYLLTYHDLDSTLKTTTFTATTFDNKVIHTVGAQVDDRSAAVIKNSVGTAIAIAKMAIGVPTDAVKENVCKPEIYSALKAVSDGKLKLFSDSLDDKARPNVTASITAARAALQLQKTWVFIPTPGGLRQTFPLKEADLADWLIDPSSGLGRPDTAIELISTEILVTPISTITSVSKPISDQSGIVFRDPVPAVVTVCPATCSTHAPIASIDSLIGQLGRYAKIDLKNYPFDKNNLSLSFSASGKLDTMTFGTESSLEKATGALQDTASQVEGFVDKRRAANKTAAEAAAGAELTSVTSQTSLINAQADLIEAQNRLAKLGGR